MDLRFDDNGIVVQGFTPRRIQAITAGVAWTPNEKDMAFRIGVDCTYYLGNDSGNSAALAAGAISVLDRGGPTFTFDTTMNIEIM